MNLVALKDADLSKDNYAFVPLGGAVVENKKKFSRKSVIVKQALHLMRKRRQFTLENFEEVFDPFELMLVCHEVMSDFEQRGRK
jgi:hypothetical protein